MLWHCIGFYSYTLHAVLQLRTEHLHEKHSFYFNSFLYTHILNYKTLHCLSKFFTQDFKHVAKNNLFWLASIKISCAFVPLMPFPSLGYYHFQKKEKESPLNRWQMTHTYDNHGEGQGPGAMLRASAPLTTPSCVHMVMPPFPRNGGATGNI